jgi:catechol 2,3-dioxygenase-like lactoylglutathione lyase family enzyme
MGEPDAMLNQITLVTRDNAATLEFYRMLGLAIPADADPTSVHILIPTTAPTATLELDAAESANIWHAGWRAGNDGSAVILGAKLPSDAAVDERYATLTAAGYTGRQPPFDAFWGARYAIVADPDGNDVGLMGPLDPERSTWPPEQSPDP